jgi:hypothetical protein
VFTGLRALPVLYYMRALNYSWRDGFCVNAAKGRRFYCRMYPRASEDTPAATNPARLIGSREMAQTEVADFLGHFDARQGGTFWMVLWGELAGAKRRVPRADQLLMEQLQLSGFERVGSSRDRALLVQRFRLRSGLPND